jgi:DNA-binding CsgD family transcriptional regulator
MKNPVLEPKHQQMLELLADGASTRTIAKKMGYSDGTVRVYLHNLYKKIGVRNRTEALLWQLERRRGAAAAPPVPAPPVPGPPAPRANETFGEVALRDGLLATLGIMESFLGPFGRVWEIGAQLKGNPPDAAALAARDDARILWRSLLQGAFSHAKTIHDEGRADAWLEDAAPHAVLLTGMLLLGGYTHAAERCLAALSKSRKGGRPAAREVALLRALRDALYASGLGGVSALHQAAIDKSNPAVRHLAMVLLFHAHRARKDLDGARDTANGVWWEAENARRQLEAMGVRPLGKETELPKPARLPQRRAARNRVAAEA